MSKKQLDEQNIVNELKGGSAFFPSKSEVPLPDSPKKDVPTPPVMGLGSPKQVKESFQVIGASSAEMASEGPRRKIGKEKNDTTTPRYHDTTVSSYSETKVETIRKAVKQQGKEAATHRFTLEEKRMLRDVVYTYLAQGVRTSENEIARIAIHFLIADYHENNETSVLARVLERLNS